MAEKKDDDKGRKDADNATDTDTDDSDDDDDDDDGEEAGWQRLEGIVSAAVDKRMEAWQAKQKTTSSSSRRKAAPRKPARKQGFLSGQFFSNLNPTDDQE